ncbi:MAG: hypothetical protein NZO58_14655 [Gemmataceae bacterium]|nr:hypothetical protein [Gemmataceae bacterium]
MTELLLEYLMDRLDAPNKRRLEERLQVDAKLRHQAELLRQALAPLAWDAEIQPPPNLAARTVARMAEYLCRPLPKAPLPARSEVSGRPWWRRVDILVAASLLLLFVGIGLPVVYRLRSAQSASAMVECRKNLFDFHRALKTYEEIHKQLPPVEPPPRNVAGMIVPILQDAGTLPRDFSVVCPGHAVAAPCSWTLQQLREMPAEEFQRQAAKLLGSYAYTLGYRDADGHWYPINRDDETLDSTVPVFGDGPPRAIDSGNSANHGALGQNVLFLSGHVQFLTSRIFDNDDIYLSIIRRVEAGRHRRDVVLGTATARP